MRTVPAPLPANLASRARLIRLDGPPVLGAVLLGMEQGRHGGYAVRAETVRTAKAKIAREL